VEIQNIVRFFTEHWAAAAVIAGLAAVGWGLLGMPGMAPDEIDQGIVQAELQGALWKGEPSMISQLGKRCGDERWASSPKASDVTLTQLELDAMPWRGERKAQGRVVVELRTPNKVCRFKGSFRYAFTSKPIGSESIPAKHRSYSRGAEISALAFDSAAE
jgi:hypothetical protein